MGNSRGAGPGEGEGSDGMRYISLYGYADDVKFSYITSDLKGHELMVQHQQTVQKWADEHTYFIHPDKLVMLKMGKSDIVKEIKIGDSVVKEKDHHKDLGIEYTSDGLDFTRVWDSKIAQMTRKSIELRSNIRSRSVVVLKQLWNSYLNSILLFGLSVIGYPDEKQLRKLMNIQRNCPKRTKNSDFCLQHTLPDPVDVIILKRDLINFNRNQRSNLCDRSSAIQLRDALESSVRVIEIACFVAAGERQNPGEPRIKFRDATYKIIHALRQEEFLGCNEARNKVISDWLDDISKIILPM